jgi:hypothetical protein
LIRQVPVVGDEPHGRPPALTEKDDPRGGRMPDRNIVAVCLAALSCGACTGSGEGLDENGRPIGAGPGPLVPEFQSIQDNVFTPVCTVCHSGAAAPLGFRLDAEASYAMLVNAPSVEVPALLRVSPGDPDGSYLIHKLEGRAAVGARMPLNAPPLPDATIQVIRQWIADGAQISTANGAMKGAASERPATLAAVWPMQDAVLSSPPDELVVAASSELDTTRLDGSSVRLERAGDRGFGDGNEDLVARIKIVVRWLDPTVIAVRVPRDDWHAGDYRLVVSGTAPAPVSGRDGRPIDGDADDAPGGDFELRFTVEQAP